MADLGVIPGAAYAKAGVRLLAAGRDLKLLATGAKEIKLLKAATETENFAKFASKAHEFGHYAKHVKGVVLQSTKSIVKRGGAELP